MGGGCSQPYETRNRRSTCAPAARQNGDEENDASRQVGVVFSVKLSLSDSHCRIVVGPARLTRHQNERMFIVSQIVVSVASQRSERNALDDPTEAFFRAKTVDDAAHPRRLDVGCGPCRGTIITTKPGVGQTLIVFTNSSAAPDACRRIERNKGVAFTVQFEARLQQLPVIVPLSFDRCILVIGIRDVGSVDGLHSYFETATGLQRGPINAIRENGNVLLSAFG
jgi:hypothetical protein